MPQKKTDTKKTDDTGVLDLECLPINELEPLADTAIKPGVPEADTGVVWRSLDTDRLQTHAQDRISKMQAAGRKDIERTFSHYVDARVATLLRDQQEAKQALKEQAEADILLRAREVLEQVYGGREGPYVKRTLAYQADSGRYDAPETDAG